MAATQPPRDEFSGLYQSLAATSLKTRTSAFAKLQLWLRGHTGLDSQALLKLWKALFYCMYMCDKPGPQQQLASDLAGLALHFRPTTAEKAAGEGGGRGAGGAAKSGGDARGWDAVLFERAFLFVEAFFITMVREFPGIDQHRKDKYLSLVRKVTHAALLLAKSHDWHPDAVGRLTELLEQLLGVGGKRIPLVTRVVTDVRLQVRGVVHMTACVGVCVRVYA
jgi:ribosomal RNA-processing protein 1